MLSKNSAPMFSRPLATDESEMDSFHLGMLSSMCRTFQLKDKEPKAERRTGRPQARGRGKGQDGEGEGGGGGRGDVALLIPSQSSALLVPRAGERPFRPSLLNLWEASLVNLGSQAEAGHLLPASREGKQACACI